jgi:hypothetical protein
VVAWDDVTLTAAFDGFLPSITLKLKLLWDSIISPPNNLELEPGRVKLEMLSNAFPDSLERTLLDDSSFGSHNPVEK